MFPLRSDSDRRRWWFEPALEEAKIDGYTAQQPTHLLFVVWRSRESLSARYAHLSPEQSALASERIITG